MNPLAAASARMEEAIFAPDLLVEKMEAAGRDLGFDHFGLVHAELRHLTFIGSDRARAGIDAYAAGGWVDVDFRAANVDRITEGRLFLDQTVIDNDARRASDIYHELYVPMDMAWFAGWRFSLGGSTWIHSLARGEAKGPVSAQEAAMLKAFMPHANRVAVMARELREVRVQGMAQGLETAGIAAILMDQDGRVSLVTPKAESLFSAEFGVRDGLMWTSDPAGAASLAALAAIARRDRDISVAPDTVIRRKDRRPLLIQPLQVRGIGHDMLPGARLLLTLVDLDAAGNAPVLTLRRLFNLSDAEADIAVRLSQGASPAAIAEHREVALETVRGQIKSLSRKLDVHRQSDIVRLVERLGRARISGN